MQFQQLVQLSSTDSRFKELRRAMKKAPPPTVPYLGILLSEMSGVVEGLPTHLEDSLINFSKMRRVSERECVRVCRHDWKLLQCVRLITNALQHQKDPYEFPLVPEVSTNRLCSYFSPPPPPNPAVMSLSQVCRVLLHATLPGNEDDLYRFVDSIDK